MSADNSNKLNVFFQTNLVGRISTKDGVSIQFEYSDSWVKHENAFPISVSIPLDSKAINQAFANNFFVNLLPEENIRARTCANLGISEGNDFELLRRIGGECAGALSILSTDEEPTIDHQYTKVSEKRMVEWCEGDVVAFAEVAGKNNIRLSLAGAQSKIPIMFDGSNFYLGKGSAPSTHIIKFPGKFSHMPENEVFTTMLANSIGVTTVDLALQDVILSPKKQTRIALIERYDRMKKGDKYFRLHQEDFCQALGLHPQKKYEQEGGPTLEMCAKLIRENCSVPVTELEKFVRWIVFNWLCHNADAHGKNISFLFTEKGKTILAPSYDLVCTRNYPNLYRNLAMQIGGEASPGAVGEAHLKKLSEDIQMPFNFIKEVSIESAAKLIENLEAQKEVFVDTFGTSPILQRVPGIVEKRCKRALKFLKKI